MSKFLALIGVGTITLLLTAPSYAMGSWFPHKGGKGGSGKAPVSHAVPGPVAGVGIPVLAAYGGYVWIRRRRKA